MRTSNGMKDCSPIKSPYTLSIIRTRFMTLSKQYRSSNTRVIQCCYESMTRANEGKSEMDRMEETIIETLMASIQRLAFDSGDQSSGETTALTGSC